MFAAAACGKSFSTTGGMPPFMSVVPSTATLTVGDTLRFRAQGPGVGESVSWSSSAPSVASVDSSGLVTAVSAGNASIGAMASGETVHATVSVVKF